MDEMDIMAMFFRIITDYQHLEWYELDEADGEERVTKEFRELLDMALTEVQLLGVGEDVTYDKEQGKFNTLLDRPTAYILAHACALMWVTPKVQSSEMLAYALTSTDFTLFSPANRLQACMKLYNEMQIKLNNLIADYDARQTLHDVKSEVVDTNE